MRKLGIALVTVVLAGTMLTLAGPADASGRTWHTVFSNRKAKIQACKQAVGFDTYRNQMSYDVSWRVNNKRGTKWARFRESGYDGGAWVQSGSIPWVAPHTKRGPIGFSPQYDSEVVNIWTRYGHHRKTGSITIAAVGLC